MEDKELFERLRQENVEIPEGITPEAMKKKLMKLSEEEIGKIEEGKSTDANQNVDSFSKKKQEKKKRRTFVNPNVWKTGAAVAAGLVICLCASRVQVVPGDKSAYSDQEKCFVQEKDNDWKQSNYKKAYKVMSRYNRGAQHEEKTFIGSVLDFFVGDSRSEHNRYAGTVPKGGMSLNEEYAESTVNEAAGDMPAGEADSASSDKKTSADDGDDTGYSKTNVRTQGVDEADVVKTDGKYIYALDRSNQIRIFDAKGEDSKIVGFIPAQEFEGGEISEIYIESNKLIAVGNAYVVGDSKHSYVSDMPWMTYVEDEDSSKYDTTASMEVQTKIWIFDVKNPAKPKQKKSFSQDGRYRNSRLVKGILYLFSTKRFPYYWIDKEKPETYVPRIDGKCVKNDSLRVPKYVDAMEYTVMSSVALKKNSFLDKKAFLGGTGQLYVSSDSIYFADNWYQKNNSFGVTKYSYKEGKMKYVAETCVKGSVEDDYSMDEYKGNLRMVVTYINEKGQNENGVFIFDKKLKPLGEITGIAKTERVYSCRFLGDVAYFVTYRETDPLFAVDLSDAKKPRILGEIKLPGFSDYLHKINDHLLLGVGVSSDVDNAIEGLKISLFDITDPMNVKEIHKCVLQGIYADEALYNPNAIYFDEDNGVMGLPASDYSKSSYYIFSIDEDKGITQTKQHIYEGGNDYGNELSWMRGVRIAEDFYVVCEDKIAYYPYDMLK